ncbi:hypothetical protein H4R34_002872 [Dimargaris verticillata]|uniref:Proteasome maturation factor UMP1 n=1 Tax=Dimargaris verticillata TaxID=2761393 RepID=A0A9W8B124_9FUNG|nr:hypothetical protein H4R34_002872 [Dimargaris verticillata]
MSSSFQMFPTASAPSTDVHKTATEYGAHDTLRHGFHNVHDSVTKRHPLEPTVTQWAQTQESLKLQMHNRLYGVHAPLRLIMERRIISQCARMQNPASLKHSNVSLDILMGKDETIDVEDVLFDPRVMAPATDIHAVMGKQLGMD